VLARNEHKNRSRRRTAEGWRCGHVYDARKEHPGLAPHEHLYYSNRETNKTLLALGYRIEPPSASDALTSDVRAR
jgi:hypothetical protein